MQRLSVFLFTSILGRKIYDEFDDVLGELKDIYVTTDEGYPRVIGYKVKKDGSTFHYEFRSIVFYIMLKINKKFNLDISIKNIFVIHYCKWNFIFYYFSSATYSF